MARFTVLESPTALLMRVQTKRHQADVDFHASVEAASLHSTLFSDINEASAFFQKGDCGFSCAPNGALQGMRIQTHNWDVRPLRVDNARSAFFDGLFPESKTAIQFDCALLMRNIRHEWHVLKNL